MAWHSDHIIVRERGNTYFGATASRFAYTAPFRDELERIVKVDLRSESLINAHPLGQFYVLEVCEDQIILRAAQSTIKGAKRYAQTGLHVIAWHEALENVNDESEQACRIRL